MKQYRSHKAVEAAKVLTVFENPDGSAVLELLGDQTEVREMVTRDWAWKHTERGRISLVGGYFVRYADRYTSWSPAKAFEEGYTEVGDAVPGLPVAGYKPTQSAAAVSLVNANKRVEESTLRILDSLKTFPGIDQRWLQMGRTHIEQGWMAINRAVFQPGRASLPGDPEGEA